MGQKRVQCHIAIVKSDVPGFVHDADNGVRGGPRHSVSAEGSRKPASCAVKDMVKVCEGRRVVIAADGHYVAGNAHAGLFDCQRVAEGRERLMRTGRFVRARKKAGTEHQKTDVERREKALHFENTTRIVLKNLFSEPAWSVTFNRQK